MSKLNEYANTSEIMKIKVQYNKEVFKFDLGEELKVIETKLNTHLKTHAPSYAFLAMLHVKLRIKQRDQQKTVKRMKDGYLVEFKGKFKTLGEAEAQMYSKKPDLKQAEDRLLHLEELTEMISVCVRSFELRKDMLQSLSANVRHEK